MERQAEHPHAVHNAPIKGLGFQQERQAGAEKQKPACLIEYNALMGGIDKSDQLAANHRAARKSLKWYKKLFFYLLDLTLVTSYCVTGHWTPPLLPRLPPQVV